MKYLLLLAAAPGAEPAPGTPDFDTMMQEYFSLDEGMDVGMDLASPVSEEYAENNNAFTGQIRFVQIDIAADDLSYMLDPEVLQAIAMTRQ